jgi:hypothetical protein
MVRGGGNTILHNIHNAELKGVVSVFMDERHASTTDSTCGLYVQSLPRNPAAMYPPAPFHADSTPAKMKSGTASVDPRVDPVGNSSQARLTPARSVPARSTKSPRGGAGVEAAVGTPRNAEVLHAPNIKTPTPGSLPPTAYGPSRKPTVSLAPSPCAPTRTCSSDLPALQ